MEYEYENDEDFAGRILWGRVAVYGVSLLIMFTLGYCISPSGVAEEEVAERDRRIMALQEEVTTLENQLAALSAGEPPAPNGEPPPEGEPGEPDEPAAGPTYEVQSGDTLNSIAQARCGSIDFASAIAELNGIDTANRLQVGQVLQLPPECT